MLILSLCVPARAQDEMSVEEDPIDKSVGACIDKDSAPNAIVACFSQGHRQWDAEVTKLYNELLGKLDNDKKETLKTAQAQWAQYRDSELRFIDALYAGEDHPAHAPLRADQRMQLIRSRALALHEYLASLEELAASENAEENDKDAAEDEPKEVK